MIYISLKVVDIRHETPDTKTICFKQPGLKKIKYLPGQYLTLIFRINGRKYSRPYSFSSAPGVDDYLEVTIKRVPGGIVSNHINDFVQIGDAVETMQPLGDFIFDADGIDTSKHIILWGAGSGITPLFSIAKFILRKNTGHQVSLVYGNRNGESIIFKDAIHALENAFPDRLKTWHFHSQLKISPATHIIEGRINPAKVLSVMAHEELLQTIHYICGPTGLKESVKSALRTLNVSDNQVFSEDFEIVKNPADFEDISTQMVKIRKDGMVTDVEVTRTKSILESGLDAGLDLDYSCQTGSCLLCKAKLASGELKVIGLTKIPEKLMPGEYLMCCSYPATAHVEIHV